MDNVLARTRPADTTAYVASFMRRVYNWMGLGLLVTAGVAFAISQGYPSGALWKFAADPFVHFGAFVAMIVIMLVMGRRFEAMQPSTATTLFFAIAVLMGISLSAIFIRYTGTKIFGTFLVTGAMFGAMSAYGYFTRRDLSAWGKFLMMALVGLILAMVFNLLMGAFTGAKVTWLNYVISIIGVVIFAGLTAHDTQRLKEMALEGLGDAATAHKASIFGALNLYLDFVNMFMFLLYLFGGDD
ncbi:MAG: Bax inhibitor-1/YccA family protein [Proteobacteria bacterium]|nr:Bax inhibitor-1/YccA family protein [Pseudomonadota bacterium]MBU1742660.1 Bax inhibitor-1/YccA family protein [Pseudomonadota bacterium]